MVRLTAPWLAAALVLAGLAACNPRQVGLPGSPAPPPAAPLPWHACGGALAGDGLECATLAVPLDYAHPDGPTIGIALDRMAASGPRIGSLLVNPGGPGASGLSFLPDLVLELPGTVLSHFDIVGFDPRGVGASAPVTCATGPQLDSYLGVDGAPVTPAGVRALVGADSTLAKECRAGTGPVLAHVGTVDAARDMERIRIAVGDAKLNYLGFSYGTFLGATYAQEYPTHIRAMVLDGAEDPSLSAIASVDTQAAAVDAELASFFDWCATPANACAWKPAGGRPAMRAAVVALVAQVRLHPLVVPGSGAAGSTAGAARSVGPNQVLLGIAESLYDPASWPGLGDDLHQASRGDGSGLLSSFDSYEDRSSNGQYDNLLVANDAVSCEDGPWPTAAQIQADAPAAAAVAPVFGLANLYSGLLCTVWPYPPTDHPQAIAAPGAPPIVVVGSTGDPATPYRWAQALASQLSKGVLLTRVGNGHTGYVFSACIRAAVDTYLVDLQPPAGGTRCPTDPS